MPVKRRAPKARAQNLCDVHRRYFLDEITREQAFDEFKNQNLGEWSYNEDRWKFTKSFWRLSAGVVSEQMLWDHNAADLVAEFVKQWPGCRPSCWWKYSAPRMQIADMPVDWHGKWFMEELRDPRKRLAGIGTPCFEVLAHVPTFHCGIPYPWVQPWEVLYYTGHAVDIHGKPISRQYLGQDFGGVAVDPSNPPQYESQASYLKRHGLFLSGEEQRLSKADFEPEVL